MVKEMANVVAFQSFSPFKSQYSERLSCEALREKEELHFKLKSVTNTQRKPWTVFIQSKCFILISKFLITRQKQLQWAQIIPSVQPRLVIEQQSTVTRSRSLTSNLTKVIIPRGGSREKSDQGSTKSS